MTELEFEKICRGPVNPVLNEFAWGTSSYTIIQPSVLSGSGITERLDTTVHGPTNLNYGLSNKRAYRPGYAAISTSTRVSSGASYYGVMNMSGNTAEFIVNAANSAAQSYDGKVGDGVLVELISFFRLCECKRMARCNDDCKWYSNRCTWCRSSWWRV